MTGKSSLRVTAEQREGLERLAQSADWEEADRARGILLSMSGWTSREIGEALRVREDTVRGWRSCGRAWRRSSAIPLPAVAR